MAVGMRPDWNMTIGTYQGLCTIQRNEEDYYGKEIDYS